MTDSVLGPRGHGVLCTITGASRTMDNVEVICLSLDHIPEQYLSLYFSPLRGVCDDQHDHTHQVGETFIFY